RYESISNYIGAKCRIFMNQDTEDFLVLNADDPMTEEILKRGRQLATGNGPRVFYFSRRKEVEGAYFKGGEINFNLPGISSSFVLHPSSFKIKGVHNIENVMAASLMALLSGCGTDAVRAAVSDFPGLEHRLEFVRETDGVKFINDSKGTNVGAVIKSLESFDEPVVLIAGGRDKDSDFTILKPFVRNRVKALVLIGEARDKIRKALGNSADVFMEDDFKTAIIRAKQIAAPGDVVLLSPACASFDMFKDFEDRGRQFKKAVMEL
ncbi:MAG: UDP-N-acetylmuramoyl-L-alanine--D-glutamate ligase, partial [Nitrospirae bacterium]|nr:UDP-N-acetylmuramoyl-L-alanine--D-glutamate ligase [Nitrospirota bacterium]